MRHISLILLTLPDGRNPVRQERSLIASMEAPQALKNRWPQSGGGRISRQLCLVFFPNNKEPDRLRSVGAAIHLGLMANRVFQLPAISLATFLLSQESSSQKLLQAAAK